MTGIDRIRLRDRRSFLLGAAAGVAVPLVGLGLWEATSGSSHPHASGAPSPASGATGSATAPSAPPGVPTASSAASAPPLPVAAGPVSLDGWMLTLPVDKHGNLSGKAKQLQQAAVTAPWLVSNSDGSLSFWAPAAGASTSNSEHSRTELVSTNDFTFGSGVHTLSALVSVTQVPTSDPDICLGQVHGGGAIKSIPFVMLHWRNGSIVVIVKQELHGSHSQSITLLTGVPLNTRFAFSITDNGDGTLGLAASCNGSTQRATAQVVSAFMGTDQRFQVGDYQQAVSSSSATDGGRATFYAINQS